MALEKAKFINNDTDDMIVVQFNPSSLSIGTNAMVSEQKTQQFESDSAVLNMGGIQSRQLGVALVFDTYENSTDIASAIFNKKLKSVKTIIDNFEFFMNSSSEISFVWGKMIFTGFINEISVQYTMFKSDGTPVRANVNISMEESGYEGEDFSGVKFDRDILDMGDENEEGMIFKILSSMM